MKNYIKPTILPTLCCDYWELKYRCLLAHEYCRKYHMVVLCAGKKKDCEKPIESCKSRKSINTMLSYRKCKRYEKKEFNQERALRILERYAHGNFETIMNYRFRTAQSFYSGSVEFVKGRTEYRKELELEFGVSIEQ